MTQRRIRSSFALIIFMQLVALTELPVWAQNNWLPITPEELALEDDPLNPGASAMILYRDTHTNDVERFQTNHYRIKIFTEEGKAYADIEIPYSEKQTSVEDIQARTVRADGTTLHFDGRVFDKVVARAKDMNFRTRTFTLPGVETGSIIEYSYKIRWHEEAPDVLRHPERYDVEGFHTIPTDRWIVGHELSTLRARFSIRTFPLASVKYSTTHLPKSRPPLGLPDGTIQMEFENVPGFQEEQYMPPVEALKSRVDIFYVLGDRNSNSESFWPPQATQEAETVEEFIDDSKGIKRAVGELIRPDDTPETKLRKLYARVLPRNLMAEQTAQEQKRKQIQENKNAEDVLKRGYGSHADFNLLFVALARAANFDASLVLVGDHFFNPKELDASQLDGTVVRVKLDSGKVYFLDPGMPYAPFGLLPWNRAGVAGFVVAPLRGEAITTPRAISSDALTERRAMLQLGTDGSLTGKVQVVFRGQEALERRLAAGEKDDLGRREQLEEEVKGWFPAGATVRIGEVSNWENPEEPLRVELAVELAEYAVRTDRRLLVPLGLFQATQNHPFAHAERVHPVYFRYPWQERDEVIVEVPAGYQIEALPENLEVPLGDVSYEISYEKRAGGFEVRRDLIVDAVLVPEGQYSILRRFFNAVKAGDEQYAVVQAMESVQRQ